MTPYNDNPKGFTSIHKDDPFYGDGDGNFPWNPPRSPEDDNSGVLKTARAFFSCGYCGSMHPDDVVTALENGATAELADMKYGFPHKFYIENAPNRYAGMDEIRSSHNEGGETIPGPITPAPSTTRGKFYSSHLVDATDDQFEKISKWLFEQTGVQFKRGEVEIQVNRKTFKVPLTVTGSEIRALVGNHSSDYQLERVEHSLSNRVIGDGETITVRNGARFFIIKKPKEALKS